jgi:FtsP/CotA-like multicopper oxidase with cupredoxin domain
LIDWTKTACNRKPSRRAFVKGLAAGGILAGLGLWRTTVWAAMFPGQPRALSGSDFELFIGETPANITGSVRTAMTINGTDQVLEAYPAK